ncbi:hypothetical protein PR202_ga30446 [Eleusine coracana subsp. coracana]|uniref:Amine oxidase n=1 Tax=Eleusine coracana subsp. coracana TaxID=191504 RepID=A0AAV5DNF5_ELECO|nr:hypothetical protein PR202_ga30446 [Eleusine coracana subsp. coracana]
MKATSYTHTDQIKEDAHGTLIAENNLGIYHDHFITFLYFNSNTDSAKVNYSSYIANYGTSQHGFSTYDVDGTNNSFVKSTITPIRNTGDPATGGAATQRRSYWTMRRVAETEADGRVRLNDELRDLLFVNSSKTTKIGNEVGYRLLLGGVTATSLLDNDVYPQRRASYTKKQVWVMPYNRSEKWVSGLYAVQSTGEDNLAVWSSKNRRIKDVDIVLLWCTLGLHHVPCQELFPVMPAMSGAFELQPFNFFQSNQLIGTN